MKHRTEFIWSDEDASMEFRFSIAFDYTPATPHVMYLRNGDPGHPGDPPEFDYDVIALLDAEWIDGDGEAYKLKLDDAERATLIRRFERNLEANEFLRQMVEDCCLESLECVE